MMKKLASCLILTHLLLASCTSINYHAEYYKYSCSQLYYKHQSLKKELERERIHRLTINAANAVVGLLQSKQDQLNHQDPYFSSNKANEYVYEAKIKAIEDLAIEKRCENVRF